VIRQGAEVGDTYIEKISEHLNIQFRVEALKIFQSCEFVPPLDCRSTFDKAREHGARCGLVVSTTSRQSQLGCKLTWWWQ
jgi:hypothetical protein